MSPHLRRAAYANVPATEFVRQSRIHAFDGGSFLKLVLLCSGQFGSSLGGQYFRKDRLTCSAADED